MRFPRSFLLVSLVVLTWSADAQPFNYDESKVPKYKLPDPLLMESGESVKTAAQWRTQRRPELLELFKTHVYGRDPGRPKDMTFFTLEQRHGVLNGLANRRQVEVRFAGRRDGPRMTILIYTPAKAKGPVPTFLGLNFRGNHTIHDDAAILLPHSWVRGRTPGETVNNRATEKGRGKTKNRWAVEMILKRGYGLAIIYYGDIDPDFDDGFKNGVHALYPKPKPDGWGSIATWAWGLSRALDYLETNKTVDHRRVAVIGHSRLGKTALWAGANDERFALVISNNSGCGGAALSRRAFGETVKRINTSFPHWFCDNFTKYNDNESACPVDQHLLVALSAPRPVYIASATQDRWADPHGEFLAAKYAAPVYSLLGAGNFPADKQPPPDQPVVGAMGYHLRTGKHDVTDYDWARYLDFADQHLGKKEITFVETLQHRGFAFRQIIRYSKDVRIDWRFMKRIVYAQATALFAAFTLAAGEPAAWEKTAPTSIEDLLAIQKQVLKIREKVRAATVSVKMGRGAGSGVIINKEGLVLTAGHVSGKPGRSFKVILHDGREFDGVALGNSPKTDSGMIQIKNPKDLPTVEYVGPSMPKRGQWCLAVGNMGGWDAKRGAVFRLGRVLAIKSRDTIQTDCKLLGGDSGGPLFDLEGRVIGIHSRIGRGPEQNFHVTMVAFHDDWKTLKDGKTTGPLDSEKRGYLGVRVSPEEDGARVTDVLPGTPADKAGLKVGDLITHVSGRELFEGTGLPEIISSTEAGEEVEIRIERAGKAMTLKAKLVSRAKTPPPPPKEEEDKDENDKEEKEDK